MEIKIKKLDDYAIIPQYANYGDAGLDLVATSYTYDAKTDCHIYGTGLAVEIPTGYVGLVFPRSSNRKKDLYLTNSVGVIDSGYRGEIMVSFKDRDRTSKASIYNITDRIAQLIILPYPYIEFKEVDELSDTERGIGGHGSTGK